MTVAPAGFKFWNAMIYTGMPALFGTRMAQVNGGLYSTASPQPAANITAAVANITLQRQGTQGAATDEAQGKWGASTALSLIDIEHWPRWPWATGAADAANAAKYAQALQATKAALGTPIALYDGIPSGGPNQYNAAPAGSAALTTLRQHTDAAAALILPHVDALVPEVYWHYDTGPYVPDAKAYWTNYAQRKIAEALRVAGGKPVYPIVWPQFHQGGTYTDFRDLPVAWWEHVLDTVIASGAHGVIIWGSFQLQAGDVISYAGKTRAWAPAVISRSNVISEPPVRPPVQPPAAPPARFKLQVPAGQPPQPPGSATLLGEFVTASQSYSPIQRPANASKDLMVTSDPAFKVGKLGNGWHRNNNIGTTGFTLPHKRLHDYFAADNLDDGGCSWARIARNGRHQYDKARMDAAILSDGGCPKILNISLTPKWAVSETLKALVRTRYGAENEWGQIFGVSRWPSYPYSAFGPENLEYLREFVRWLYRPTNQLGPGGEAGAGYTVDQIPILEWGNEAHFAADVPNAGRWWDASWAPNPPNAFCLQTMSEFASCIRAVKEAAPAGVLVAAGGWEGEYIGRTLAAPTAALSGFQAAMLSDDGAGGLAINHIDLHFFHPYIYDYAPGIVQTEIDGHRAQLEWLAQHLSRPAIANMPIHANETGHEAPTGVQGAQGSGTYIINTQGTAGYETLARNMRTSTAIAIGNAAKQRCVGIAHYIDAANRQTYGAPSSNAVLSAAAAWCNRPVGRVLRQAYQLSDGTVTLSFEGGLVLNSGSSTPIAGA